jgi:hypothetical protein
MIKGGAKVVCHWVCKNEKTVPKKTFTPSNVGRFTCRGYL